MSAPWRTVGKDVGDVEDERRGADDGPLLSLLTERSAAAETRAEPAEVTLAGPRRGGGGDGVGGGGGGGPGSPHPATAWWRAERVLPHGLRAVTFLPLIALVLILGALV